MSAFLDKVSDFFFKNDDDDAQEETRQFEEPVEAEKPNFRPPVEKPTKKGNLISVPSKSKNAENVEIVLFKAATYDDMQEIARHIKERKIAVVNFEDMDKDVAQRMVDFLSGAAFALDGVPRKVSGGTFIFSSSQVDMSGQIMDRGSSFEAEDFTDDSRFSSSNWLRP
jgi:cell division inhibitor SepF